MRETHRFKLSAMAPLPVKCRELHPILIISIEKSIFVTSITKMEAMCPSVVARLKLA